MRRLRRHITCLVAAGSIVLLLGPTAKPVLASCNPGRSWDGVFYSDGWYRSSVSPGGVWANLDEKYPYVDSSHSSDYTEAYVELTDTSGGAQAIGWRRYLGTFNSSYVFLESDLSYDEYDDAWGQNSSITYKVLYGNCASGSYSFFSNGQQYTVTQLGSDCVSASAANGANMAGAINSLSDQMPGNTSDYMHFKSANIYLSGGWQAFNGSVSDPNGTIFGHQEPSSSEIDVWDKACSS